MKLNKKEIKDVKDKIARETTIAQYTYEESRQDLNTTQNDFQEEKKQDRSDDENDNFFTPVKAT